MSKKILVIGGTGSLGQPVAHHLKESGFEVRVMSRDVEKAKNLFDESFELVQGDVTDSDSLAQALNGCQGVHISVMGDDDLICVENIVALVPKLKLERITYISGSTVFEQNRWFPMIEQKLIAEKAIRECGVPYTIFCPTWPMDMLPSFVRNGKPSQLGKQPTPIHWFAVDDLGRMVAAAYQREEAANKRLIVHGPEGIPMKEALGRYCRVFYPEAKKVSVTPIWLIKVIAIVTRNEMLKFVAGMMAYFDKVGEMGDPTEANEILGGPTTTLDAWLKQKQIETAQEMQTA
jgi:uncharacterized protein YbjT (DUF2867 family)